MVFIMALMKPVRCINGFIFMLMFDFPPFLSFSSSPLSSLPLFFYPPPHSFILHLLLLLLSCFFLFFLSYFSSSFSTYSSPSSSFFYYFLSCYHGHCRKSGMNENQLLQYARYAIPTNIYNWIVNYTPCIVELLFLILTFSYFTMTFVFFLTSVILRYLELIDLTVTTSLILYSLR